MLWSVGLSAAIRVHGVGCRAGRPFDKGDRTIGIVRLDFVSRVARAIVRQRRSLHNGRAVAVPIFIIVK